MTLTIIVLVILIIYYEGNPLNSKHTIAKPMVKILIYIIYSEIVRQLVELVLNSYRI